MELRIRACKQSDLARVCEILDQCALPSEDVLSLGPSCFFVAEVEGHIVGVGGIEIKHYVALVRSIAVEKKYSGQGIGQSIYTKIEQHAYENGVARLYLLTTTASSYFARQGFQELEKDLAPTPIKTSTQFSKLCPDSATLMHKSLSRVNSQDQFDAGLYCAESVLSTVAEHYDIKSELIPKMATGFCSGMARTCGTCGALTGGILAINLMTGRETAANTVENNYASVQKLADEFKTLYGTTNCQELLDCDLGSESGQQKFNEHKLHKRCREYTGMAADLAVKIIDKTQ